MNNKFSAFEGENPREPHPNRDDLVQAARDLGDALDSAKQCSQRWLAWQKLNMIPHSPEEIAGVESALDPGDDGDIIHHLAIAYHALAWDLERCEPDRAFPLWKKAFYYWRKLQSCGAFWHELCEKGDMLGEMFERNKIEEFRKNLIRSLLEIHVNFIRYYYELKKSHQASRHIDLIRQAQISPADRKHFEILVYEAMTSTVPNVVGEGHFSDALTILDHFLGLFPSYPPALQNYLEITKQWVERMSPATQWEEILKLDRQVLPKWDTLNTSKRVHQYPLASNALSDLAGTMGGKHLARAKSLRMRDRQKGQHVMALECEEYQSYKQAIRWLKRVGNLSPDNIDVQTDLYNALLLRADFTTQFCLITDENDTALPLLDQALLDCQGAMKLAPDEKIPRELAGRIQQIKAEYRLRVLDGLSDEEFIALLKDVEKDLEKAIQFDPGNQSLGEMLKKIRETLGELKTIENHGQ